MKVFIILAGLLMLGACTGKPEGFVLKGELKGAPDDHWVFLTNTGQTHYYDSTRLKNGRSHPSLISHIQIMRFRPFHL